MKKYYYRNGEQVKAGDFCFYSEDDGNSNFHYANSIMEIAENDEDLISKVVYFTFDDGITLERNDLEDPGLSLQYSCGYKDDSNVLQHYIKIDEFKDDVKWVNENFGRKNKKRKIDKFIKENLLNIPYKSKI